MSHHHPVYSTEELRAEVLKLLKDVPAGTPVSITTLFDVEREEENAFLALAGELERQTTGADDFDVRRQVSEERQARYLVYEDWPSVDAFRANWNSEHVKKFQFAVGNLLTSAPVVTPFIGSSKNLGKIQVLATGQTHCWNSDGNPIDCAGTGQDGAIGAGLAPPEPRFVDNGNGAVTDGLTGLIWLKDANVFGEVPWEAALQIAKTLKDGMAGLSDGSKEGDWRMPNVNELQSLLDLDNPFGPAISPANPFRNLECANYWSSTSVAAATPLGWYTALAVGPPVFDLKFNSMRMWPARGNGKGVLAQTGQTHCFDTMGQPIDCGGTGQDGALRKGVSLPEPRFTDNQDGTVTDNLTGLVWLRDANPFGTKCWDEALEACNSLASGHGGLKDNSRAGQWRLPNLCELRSLMDYDQFGPALTKGHPFQNVRTSLYWSSSTVASAPNLARFVFVGLGPSVWDHKSVLMNVWPVRSTF